MSTTINRESMQKILTDGRVTGIEVVISINGIPYTNTFPPGDEGRLELAIKNWSIGCVKQYDRSFSEVVPETRQPIDPSTVAFDGSAIISEARA